MNKHDLTKEFELFRGQLRSYILRMTVSVQDTDDLIQDTFVRAYTKLDGFKGESSLKTWVFTIATNLAKDLQKSKNRWPENVTDICKEAALNNPEFFGEAMQISTSSSQGHFEIREHIAFCFTCVSKSLPLEQQLCLLLKEIYDFKVKEVAEIIDQSEAMVKYYLHIGRSKMVEVFDHRCSLINKKECVINVPNSMEFFNPKQDVQRALVEIQMAKDANTKDKQTLLDLRMKILQEIDPFESSAAELQLHHLEHNRKVMEKILEEN
ncbi:MAG: RNA polymerase sigma factor [Saprospiraceae bacterium]|nr:RNA polymerase sigma factor [Saprospiraceae bacterium]